MSEQRKYQPLVDVDDSVIKRRLDVTLKILERSYAQLVIAFTLFVGMSYNNYALISEQAKKALQIQGQTQGWSEREQLMAFTLLKKLFLDAFVSSILVSRGLRDYLFAESAIARIPLSTHARAFWRNVLYLALGLLVMINGMVDASSLEGHMPWQNLLTYCMVQGCCVLYLAGTIRDVDDAREIRSMTESVDVKFYMANATLKRSNGQLILSALLCGWVTYLNYGLFSQTATKTGTTITVSELFFAKVILAGLFLYCSIAATAFMAGGLRDFIYGEAVAASFPGSIHARGSRNLRYFFGGLAMLVTGLIAYHQVREMLPWENTLVFLSVEALATLLFLTPWRDRLDAERAEAEGDVSLSADKHQ